MNVAPPPTRANAWEDVADLSRSFGIELDLWQEVVLQSAMGERSDGTWCAKRVGLSAPRQNGKSQLIVARALAGALLFGETKIVISAHKQDTARETFDKILEMRDASPALDERIDKVMTALNREYVQFKNGAKIQFKARSVSGSRGFSADCLLLDEAQILGMPAWVSINSTMSARPNPQVWLLGTPPTPEDVGDVFTSVRTSALQGKSSTLAWVEWAAAPGADPALPATRASANPAWWTRINHEVVQGEYETYPPDRFALDRLGIWRTDAVVQVIPRDLWNTRKAITPPAPDAPPSALGLDRWHDGSTSLSAAWRNPTTGASHVELIAFDVAPDAAGVVDAIVARAGRSIPVVVSGDSPAASLVPDLRRRGVRVNVTSIGDLGKACVGFYDDVVEGRLTHAGQGVLDQSLAGAKKRKVGDAGAWGWDRKNPENDISALVSVTLARFGASVTKTKTNRAVFA